MSFKKIVSDLSFSPAMMGQLSLLANKIKKEELIRRIGLLLFISTLLIQSLIILQPSEQTNSLSISEMIARGYEPITDNCLDVTSFECIKDLNKSITANNSSQGNVDAKSVVAQAGDHISYTVSFTNASKKDIKVIPQIHLSDTLEYSEIIQNDGATIDNSKNILSWGKTTLSPNSTQTRTYTISLLDKVPTTSRGKNYKKSHDCVISNTFGNKIDIDVNCPTIKQVEKIYLELPQLSLINFIIISAIGLSLITYHYLIARQIKKEIQIIRRNANAGTI